ncbi:MAG: LytR family transcriptional regulator [Lachnospiraceae bacterium]|nr:LytR family transcriptional regulator [Lachnospiraceae bacterium]
MSAQQKRNARKKKNSKGKVVFLIGEVLVLVVLVVVLGLVLKTTNKDRGITKYEIDDVEGNSEVIDKWTTDENMQKYTNIALFGVDSRNGKLSTGTRTDTIMILSVNNNTGEARLVSVYRDTYLNLGNDTYNKCNAAYAKGGPEQAISMLNMNLDLYITDFVTIGFDGLMAVIDAVGGVEIDIKENEIKHLNNYQASMYATEENPGKITTDYEAITESGLQTLSGYQAVAYCRIRAVGNDFGRTERQRNVLQAVLDKAKNASVSELNEIAEEVFPLIATSLDLDEILSLIANVANYEIVGSSGFPFDSNITTGKIGSKGSCVIPLDLTTNVELLHEYLYPEVEYSPSPEVLQYSQQIESDTSPYVGTMSVDEELE